MYVMNQGYPTRSSTMKKGKINLLSFEENDNEEEDLNIQMKPSTVKKAEVSKSVSKPPLDLSQIKDRVIQMEVDEEMVIEGEIAEALFKSDTHEDEDLIISSKIKEAKEKRKELCKRNQEFIDNDEELPDYIPITTKGDYWLTQDTKESENSFNKNSSRLVREDLFNEIEVDDASGAYTSFIGKSVEGRQGLMMTKKMLERDIKTELYDMELDLDEPFEEFNDDEINWEKSQILKGIEKGWNRPDDEMIFYSKQAKLPIFIPPPAIDKQPETLLVNFVDTKEIEANVNRIEDDTRRLEIRAKELELEIESKKKKLNNLNEIETFFMRYSRFLTEKLPELTEISSDRSKWEHFFDDVDVEDSDLLDLPDIINKITISGLGSLDSYKQLSELFIRYHFMAMDFEDSSDPKEIWENSGLAEALKQLDNPMELLTEVFANDLDKLKRIEREINFK